MLNDLIKAFLVVLLQFLSGSIMYSHLLLKSAKAPQREDGDGNPGVLNLWQAAGWKYGVAGLLLDYLKGIFPLLLFILSGFVTNNYIIAVAALAGIAGHAFSPFLKFKGGKSITTTFGAWTVFSKWEGPVVFGGMLGILYISARLRKKRLTKRDDVLIVMSAFLGLSLYALYNAVNGNYAFAMLFLGNVSIVIYKHKKELSDTLKGILKRRGE